MDPRERLLRHGPEALDDAELLAVLLGRSSPKAATRLLEQAGGLGELIYADHQTLRSYGVQDARASLLLAHLELSKRATRAGLSDGQLMVKPEKIAAYIAARHAAEDQEIMGALYLNIRDHLIGERVLFRGTLGRMVVEPRQILREALRHRASKFILWHTHPSGLPYPSAEDIGFTRRIATAAEIVGVSLSGHVIVGNGGRYSALSNPLWDSRNP